MCNVETNFYLVFAIQFESLKHIFWAGLINQIRSLKNWFLTLRRESKSWLKTFRYVVNVKQIFLQETQKNTNRHRNVGDDAIPINGDREEFVIIIILKTYFRFLLYRSTYAPHPPSRRNIPIMFSFVQMIEFKAFLTLRDCDLYTGGRSESVEIADARAGGGGKRRSYLDF